MKYSYCTKCGYETDKLPRWRDINKQISLDGGKMAIYDMQNNICPACKGKDTLRFVSEK